MISVGNLFQEIDAHPGMRAIENFNKLLCTRALTHDQRKIFFASLHHFNNKMPARILSLAGEIIQKIEETTNNKEKAYEIAGFLLEAGIDEFGLTRCFNGTFPQDTLMTAATLSDEEYKKTNDIVEAHNKTAEFLLKEGDKLGISTGVSRGKPHQQMFREFAEDLGLSKEDIYDQNNATPTSSEMERIVSNYTLGIHDASEVTSGKEYAQPGWETSFIMHNEYGIIDNDHSLETFKSYIKLHATVEQDHIKSAGISTVAYCENTGTPIETVIIDAKIYMDGYQAMFNELSKILFPEVASL